MQIVFIGQQPATPDDEGQPLIIKPNSSGERLQKWMGVTPVQFEEHFMRVNLNPWADTDEFTPGHHVAAARNLYELLYGRRVVLLGPSVAEAFGIRRKSFTYFHFYDHPEAHFLFSVMPHPSGLNRLYNNPATVGQAKKFLRKLWDLRYDAPLIEDQPRVDV